MDWEGAGQSVICSVWLVGLRTDEAIRCERRLLRRIGCAVTVVPSFEAARVALASGAPDVLVAPIRLGAYNGIHLAIIANVGAPVPALVIIDEPEAHHELEARQAASHYLVRPVRAGELAGLIRRIALTSDTHRRLTRRIRARRDVVLSLDGIDGIRVLEFSDGGMRLAVPAGTSSKLPSVFDVSVGEHEVTVRQAWRREGITSTHFGLLVYQESPSCAHHWRGLRALFSGNNS